jgi:hypothetical protein
MDFETKILSAIRHKLGDNEHAGFIGGSLFVMCAEDTCKSIYSTLTDLWGYDRVKVHRVGAEYVFDFVE